MKKIIPFFIGIIILGPSTQAFLNTNEILINSNYFILNNSNLKDDFYDFIIITPENFLNELEILREHKEQYEIKTKIITLLDIYNSIYFSVQGRDNAEKIKYFIKSAIENWGINYVLMVGTKETMPVRFVENTFGNHHNRFICDLYYSDIYDENESFCSWDSNSNDVFGEVNGSEVIDNVNLFPDISIGRILCDNKFDLTIVIQKIISYENNVYHSDWFNRIVLFGGDSQPTFSEIILPFLAGKVGSIVFEGEYIGDKIAKILHDFEVTKIYSTGFIRSNAEMLTTENVNNAINQGAGFVELSGHGNPDRIFTYFPFAIKWKNSDLLPNPLGYTLDDIKSLNNQRKLPIMLFSACSCGDFDALSVPLAWEFIRYEHGGAIACLANTNPTYLIPSSLCTDTVSGHLLMTFFESYAKDVNILGDLWKETIVHYVNDEHAWDLTRLNWGNMNISIMNLEVWTLFGDPTLKLGGYNQF